MIHFPVGCEVEVCRLDSLVDGAPVVVQPNVASRALLAAIYIILETIVSPDISRDFPSPIASGCPHDSQRCPHESQRYPHSSSVACDAPCGILTSTARSGRQPWLPNTTSRGGTTIACLRTPRLLSAVSCYPRSWKNSARVAHSYEVAKITRWDHE